MAPSPGRRSTQGPVHLLPWWLNQSHETTMLCRSELLLRSAHGYGRRAAPASSRDRTAIGSPKNQTTFHLFLRRGKFRLMGNMLTNIRQIRPSIRSSHIGFALFAMNMNAVVRKIWQTAAVIKMHMAQDDVAYFRWLVTQMLYLLNGGFHLVLWDFRDNPKYVEDAWMLDVIIFLKPGINQYRTLAGFNQQSQCSCLPTRRNKGIAGKAIQIMGCPTYSHLTKYALTCRPRTGCLPTTAARPVGGPAGQRAIDNYRACQSTNSQCFLPSLPVMLQRVTKMPHSPRK